MNVVEPTFEELCCLRAPLEHLLFAKYQYVGGLFKHLLIIVHDMGIDFLLYAMEKVVHVETITGSSPIPRLPLCSCAHVLPL